LKIIIITMTFLMTTVAHSAIYYIDRNLVSDCAGGARTSYSIAARNCSASDGKKAWKRIYTANIKLVAGDIVYIRGGNYTAGDPNTYSGSIDTMSIAPSNSGTAGKVITYSVYPDEQVTVTGNNNRSFAINLTGKSYIRVTGITFKNFHKFMWIDGGHYNEIEHCIFDQVRYLNTDGKTVNWRGSTIFHSSTHNYIHDNTFSKYGSYTTSNQLGVVFEIGTDAASKNTDASHYNTIVNNHFYHGGHHVLGVNSRYNILRNNYIHNEGWWAGPNNDCAAYTDGLCGYRVMSMAGLDEYGGHNLVEGNRIAYGGPEISPMGAGSGLTVSNKKIIVRYNDLYGNGMYGARFGSSLSAAPSSYNYFYNNTLYHNGYGTDIEGILPHYRTGIYFNAGDCSLTTGNVLKNNLFHANSNVTRSGDSAIHYADKVGACQTITNNCLDCTSDPLFVNPDITDPMSTTLPNLTLRKASPIIDKGTYLTKANGNGTSSTKLEVKDARYFQDGSWGSDLARAKLYADWIAIGTLDKVAQISSINYNTNTITLASPQTWVDSAKIWLFKKSDGAQVIYGTAPDMGAHEYEYISPQPKL